MIDETFQAWRLDDVRQTLVLAARRTRLPEVVYWGPPLPEDEDLGTLYWAHILDVTGGMLDENPDLSILPEAVRTFPVRIEGDVSDGAVIDVRLIRADADRLYGQTA